MADDATVDLGLHAGRGATAGLSPDPDGGDDGDNDATLVLEDDPVGVPGIEAVDDDATVGSDFNGNLGGSQSRTWSTTGPQTPSSHQTGLNGMLIDSSVSGTSVAESPFGSRAATPSASTALKAHAIAWEDLTITRRLGVGGFGEVLAGFYCGTPVAVKRLKTSANGEGHDGGDDGSGGSGGSSCGMGATAVGNSSAAEGGRFMVEKRTFLREIEMLSHLRHPNVLRLLCYCADGRHLCLVTEFLREGDLYNLLFHSHTVLTERTKLDLLRKAAAGMTYLHRKGVIHRDIKPHNILLDHSLKTVVVADFGLANFASQTGGGSFAGTVRYAPPEMFLGVAPSPAFDVFSFGVVAFEVLTRTRGFSGHARVDDLTLPIGPAFVGDPEYGGALGMLMNDLVFACLAFDPGSRPSFERVGADLDAVAEQNVYGHVFASVPPLGRGLLPRLDLVEQARRLLVAPLGSGDAADKHGNNGGVALTGIAGVGKTVVATMLARDDAVRKVYTDGVHWIAFASSPQLEEVQTRLLLALGLPPAATLEEGKAALRLALANARALLVLDGVASAWRAAAFDVAGPLCRVVVTTRSTRVASRLGLDLATISVGPLSDDEAVMLLASSAGVPVDQIPDSGPRIAAKCGALPLTVNLVGSALSGKAEARWKAMEDTLVRATPEAGRRDGLASVMAAVEVSVAELHVLRYRFRDLCAFRPGAPLPVGLLAAFWERLAEPLTHRDTELVLEALAERGLLEASDLALVYRVPALQAQYLDETTPPDGVREVQRRFVVAVCAAFGCEPSHAGIDGDARDGLVAVDWEATAGSDVGAYCIRFLVHHLIGAGWVGTAVRLLTRCFSFLAARAAADNVLGIIADCEAAAKAAAADTSAGGTNQSGIADLVALADLLRLSFPVLADDPSQLWFQLCGRLSMPDRLEEYSGVLQALALSAAARGRETGRLLPIGRVLRPPGGARRAVLRTSESSTVVALTPSPFGTVAAADLGGRVRIWDTSLCLVASEAESPWTEPETSGADPPPHQHAPGNADDVELGEPDEPPLPPPPPPPPTSGMGGAPLPPSRPVASAATSAPLMRHLVFSADGRALVGCGDRGVVAVWKAASGSLIARFAVAGATSLYGLALSADETRVCVGGADKTLYMLKIRTGKVVAAVRAAHRMRITAVAIVEPAKPIVISASLDRTIQIRSMDLDLLRVIEGDGMQGLSALAWLGGGHLVCSSFDRTVRVWDTNTSTLVDRVVLPAARVSDLAPAGDGLLVAGCGGGLLALLDMGRRRVATVDAETSGIVRSVCGVAGSPPGVCASGDDGVINVFDVGTAVDKVEAASGWRDFDLDDGGAASQGLAGPSLGRVGVYFGTGWTAVATADSNLVMRTSAMDNRHCVRLVGCRYDVTGMWLDESRGVVITTSLDGSTRKWEADHDEIFVQTVVGASPMAVMSMAVTTAVANPLGQILIAHSNGYVEVRRIDTMECVMVRGDAVQIETLGTPDRLAAISPDATLFALASAAGMARVYSMDDPGPACLVAVDVGGSLSGSRAARAIAFFGEETVQLLAVTPDGFLAVVPCEQGSGAGGGGGAGTVAKVDLGLETVSGAWFSGSRLALVSGSTLVVVEIVADDPGEAYAVETTARITMDAVLDGAVGAAAGDVLVLLEPAASGYCFVFALSPEAEGAARMIRRDLDLLLGGGGDDASSCSDDLDVVNAERDRPIVHVVNNAQAGGRATILHRGETCSTCGSIVVGHLLVCEPCVDLGVAHVMCSGCAAALPYNPLTRDPSGQHEFFRPCGPLEISLLGATAS